MVDRNEIEGRVLGSIDAAFNAEWWDHICKETQEDIRDKLSVVWDMFFPAPQNSDNSEAVEQPLTQVKTPPPATPDGKICPSCGGPVWIITQAPSFQCKDIRCQRSGKLFLT